LVRVLAGPHVRVYTGAAAPPQFTIPLDIPFDAAVRANHPPVLGVAHNAGNNARTTAAALRHRADVIEIDVIEAGGRLVAGRVQPWPWLAERMFRGPTLEQAWEAAAAAPIVKLDLQENDQTLLDQLVDFLRAQPASRRVMVSTRDPNAIRFLRPRLPVVDLLFSTAFPAAVHMIESDPSLAAAANGLSAFEGLVDIPLTKWAHSRGMIILAWTVNDATRLDQLLTLGVDGVTTQNLAVLDALAGRLQAE